MANAETQRTLRGCLVQYGDKGVQRPLHAGARVLAQFHGNTDLAWYAGVATLQNTDGSWRIEYEDVNVEDLRVVPPGRKLPCIKHFDGAYVLPPPQDGAGHGGARRTKKRKPRNPSTVHHAGFQFMRIDPAPPAAVDAPDDLAGRIHFSYKEEKARDGTVTASEVKYVTLCDIVLEANADIARMQQQAFVDFLTHLYTTPPVSAENIKHMLGPQVMEGWTPSERKRVDRNFKVFKRAQVQEEERRAKKTKSV
jgi:hypothetical protein